MSIVKSNQQNLRISIIITMKMEDQGLVIVLTKIAGTLMIKMLREPAIFKNISIIS